MKVLTSPPVPEALRLFAELAAARPATPPHRIEKPLVLYGAGHLGRMAADFFQRLDIPIAYALDQKASVEKRLAGSIQVIHPEAAGPADRTSHIVAVCVVTAPYEPIRDYLLGLGWKHVVPVYDLLSAFTDRIAMNNGWFAGHVDDEDIAAIDEVLRRWDDDASRATHLQSLAWRMRREEWHFQDAPVCIDDRYFIQPILDALGPDECFLDAGAHHGAILSRFLAMADGKFAQALAIEPDRHNVAALRAHIAAMPLAWRDRIQVLDRALAAKDGELPFCGGMDMASRLVGTAEENVRTMRLDELDFPVTFGKIHLEGGELDALRGGIELLLKCRPLLAVTVYHNRDGLWRIPHFLMTLLPDYRILMRAHGWCGTGCVVYAIPAERQRASDRHDKR